MGIDRSQHSQPRAPLSRQSPLRSKNSKLLAVDSWYGFLLLCASAVVLLIILAIILEIYLQSRQSMHTFGAKFLTTKEWDPVDEVFGARVFILGTIYTSLWALLLAIPLSLGTALLLADIAPALIRKPVGFLIELFAAIPSVVYGMWGILVLVPWLLQHVETPISESQRWGRFFLFDAAPNGNDFLAASVLLSIMVIPIITGIARDVIRAVPQEMREAAYALGCTKWEVIRKVVVPCAKTGIVGAVMLGLGRALGETMAVTMVIGNSPDFSLPLFSPGYTMPSVIANEFTEAPSPLYRSALMEIALILLVVAILVNGAARLMVSLTSRRFRRVIA